MYNIYMLYVFNIYMHHVYTVILVYMVLCMYYVYTHISCEKLSILSANVIMVWLMNIQCMQCIFII